MGTNIFDASGLGDVKRQETAAMMLWVAVLGTQTIATLIAVYGLFMTPLGWHWAPFVWGHAISWFLVSDRIKLFAYRIFG